MATVAEGRKTAGAGASARAVAAGRHRSRSRRLLTAGALAGAAVGIFGAVSRSGEAAGWRVLISAALAVAALVVGLTGLAVDADRWDRGAAGEVATAAALDRLSPRRWVVWHDLRVPGSRANIDHLVVGRTGVWVIDTKTTRAAVRAHWWGVRFGERRLDTDAVRWETEIVADRLAGRLGREVPVRPLVAVHGRGITRRGGRAGGVEVVPAAAVADRVRHGRRRLRRGDRAELAEAVDSIFVPGPR